GAALAHDPAGRIAVLTAPVARHRRYRHVWVRLSDGAEIGRTEADDAGDVAVTRDGVVLTSRWPATLVALGPDGATRELSVAECGGRISYVTVAGSADGETVVALRWHADSDDQEIVAIDSTRLAVDLGIHP